MKPTQTSTDAILAAAILSAMAENLKTTPKQNIRKDAKEWAVQIRELYLGIKDAGFDDNQAMRLTLAVINKQ